MNKETAYARITQVIPRSFWYSVGITFVCLSVLAVLIFLSECFALFPQSLVLTITLPITLLSFALSWVGSKRVYWKRDGKVRQRGLHTWIPLIFSMALACQFLGSSLHSYYVVQHVFIFPTWADALILGTYLLLILGVLRLPTRSLSGRVRLRILLDSSLIIVALLTFSWYFLLGPMLLSSAGEAILAIVTHLAVPGFDLLLIGYVILFMAYAPDGPLRFAVRILSLGLLIFALTDSFFQYQLLQGVFTPGWYILGWTAGNFLIALAVQSMRWTKTVTSSAEEILPHQSSRAVIPMWQALLPYALVPAVFGLAFSIWQTGRTSPLAIGAYICSLLLLVLIFVKQVVTIREVHWLNRGLKMTQDNLHEKNQTLEMLNMRLEALATTDPLTELPNHRTVMKQLGKELDRARRSQHPLSVLFFDADRFKRVNDTYGHAAGDAVLCQIGERTSSVLRAGDTPGRFGGEEFVIVLPEADVEEARVVAERIRTTVAAEPMATSQVEGGIAMTVSIGISTYPIDGDSEQDLLLLADEAMYVAKRLGRNQVRTVEEARLVGADVELMAILQQDGQQEAVQRDGVVLEHMRETYTLRTTYSLLSLLERRDEGLSAHAHAVSDLSAAIAQMMNLPSYEVSRIGMAGLLHDIGKVAIPDRLLQKVEPLSPQEHALLLEHAELGAQILESSPFLTDLMPAVRHHHEHWDGSGSPDNLVGQAIPLAARIIAVAEAYDFMCREHPYLASRTSAEAMKELQRCANTQFDPVVVQALMNVLNGQKGSQRSLQTASN